MGDCEACPYEQQCERDWTNKSWGSSVNGRKPLVCIPLILILSPKCASERISGQSVIVREVPLPPPSVSSNCSRAETAGWCQFS